MHETVASAGVRPEERTDFRLLPVPPASDELLCLSLTAAVITIASKFVLRLNGKHLFNPTNFGIAAMMLRTGQVWVSPGQWGNVAFFAFLMACLGGLVVNRAARSDVTFAFIVSTCRSSSAARIWLGEPMVIPLHRLESGALLLFTFFMISDRGRRRTPGGTDSVRAAGGCGAWYSSSGFPNERVPLVAGLRLYDGSAIDWLLPGARYEWSRPRPATGAREVTYETADSVGAGRRGLVVVGSGAERLLRFLRN